jgi:hypothetical protein
MKTKLAAALGVVLSVFWAVATVAGSREGAGLRSATVQVIDSESGLAVSDARIEVRRSGEPEVDYSATTGSDGSLDLPFPDRTSVATVRSSGFAPSRFRWPPKRDQQFVEVRLERAVTLQVETVSASSGLPLRSTVSLAVNRPGNPGLFGQVAEDGVARFLELPPANVIIVVKGEGLSPTARQVALTPGESNIQVRLIAEATAFGTIVNESGAPLADAKVTIKYPESVFASKTLAQLVGGATRSDAEGRFWLTNLVAHTTAELLVTRGDGYTGAATVATTEGQASGPIVVRVRKR